jgi:hypothetical protein
MVGVFFSGLPCLSDDSLEHPTSIIIAIKADRMAMFMV